MLSEFFMNTKIALSQIDIFQGKSTYKAWNIVLTSIDWIGYTTLCILAIYLVTEVMADYANKRTSMSSEEHPITEHPQISICFNNPTTTEDAGKAKAIWTNVEIIKIIWARCQNPQNPPSLLLFS